jgi:hypothetical protein
MRASVAVSAASAPDGSRGAGASTEVPSTQARVRTACSIHGFAPTRVSTANASVAAARAAAYRRRRRST